MDKTNINIAYTYWQADGWFIGFLNDYPEQETQGKTLAELEDMLRSLYEDIAALDVPYLRRQGTLRLTA